MQLLKEKIINEGKVKEGNILKVDNFLNHRLDIQFLQEVGKEFKRIFSDVNINKILTIEASGIAIASIVAQYFDNIPVVFAKKAKSQNLDGDLYTSTVKSYTYSKNYTITVAQKFLKKNDNILIIDDFLAEGNAMKGLIDVVNQSKANVAGVGIVIEKGYQNGGKDLRNMGIRVESLAIIDDMNENEIIFRK
ncbi:MAG: xanthine phosphoribosyltransferase [Erysipelotrichaceae bacterium]|nr:xanthine phosphoribosyltransferase [Erysipelotrichaceae bacterium]